MSLALLGELEEFWECQGRSSVRGNEKLIISVELNEWVRTARSDYEGGLGQYGDKRINEARKLILEICKERNLFVANMMSYHDQIYMYTWQRAEGKSMIDLFLVDQRI